MVSHGLGCTAVDLSTHLPKDILVTSKFGCCKCLHTGFHVCLSFQLLWVNTKEHNYWKHRKTVFCVLRNRQTACQSGCVILQSQSHIRVPVAPHLASIWWCQCSGCWPFKSVCSCISLFCAIFYLGGLFLIVEFSVFFCIFWITVFYQMCLLQKFCLSQSAAGLVTILKSS